MPSSPAAARRRTKGRYTPPLRSVTAAAPGGTVGLRQRIAEAMSGESWDVSQSRSVRSGWVWRGIMVLSLLALGVAIILAGNHQSVLAVFWVVIAAGWFSVSVWVWRMHARYLRGD